MIFIATHLRFHDVDRPRRKSALITGAIRARRLPWLGGEAS